MKKIITALCFLAFPIFSYADTVNIKFVMDTETPAQPSAIVAQGNYAFKGTSKIVFKIVGKTCEFVGSAQAIGPTGCNYWLTANVSKMQLSDPKAENNPGCTAPQNMLASCK